MKLKAVIVDDEPLAHEVIEGFLAEVPFIELVGRCYAATEAIDLLGRMAVDVVFLDIQMPKLKGTDFLRIIEQRPLTIITSAHAEYAVEGFELDVCDYLVKPFRFARFLKAVNKVRQRAQTRQPAAVDAPPPTPAQTAADAEPSHLFIKVDKKLIQVALADIDYLEAYGNYVKVWLGEQHLLTARTLSSFETQLCGGAFVRIHKSYLVQRRHIRYLEAGVVVMRNGAQLPLGKNYKNLNKSLPAH